MSCQPKNIENFDDLYNPLNFDTESKTYTVNGGYYSPPWPMQRSQFDMDLQTKFSTSNIPDFLNYSSTVEPFVSNTDCPVQNPSIVTKRKSVLKGQYYKHQ